MSLRRFVLSSVWLDGYKCEDGRATYNLMAPLAAGFAIFVTLELTFVSSNWFTVNTTGFLIAAILTYMLKDRVKDGFKKLLSRKVSQYLSDYRVSLRDAMNGFEIGSSRETFKFVDTVPRDVEDATGPGRPHCSN